MKIKCPVCKKQMFSPHKNNNFVCETKEEFIPELKVKVEYNHASVYMDDTGQAAIKRIDVLPYSFEIIDQGDVKQTRIMKITNPAFRKRTKDGTYERVPSIRYGDLTLEIKTLIVVPNAINVQWDDKNAVLERVKMFMLFS